MPMREAQTAGREEPVSHCIAALDLETRMSLVCRVAMVKVADTDRSIACITKDRCRA